MYSRFFFTPPKQTLLTTSGTRILPSRSPSGAKQWTPSAAEDQMRPAVSTRKPSNRPASQVAKTRPFFSLPLSLTSKARMWRGPSGSCEAPVSI